MSRFPDVHFLISAAAPGQFPPDTGVEVAIAGRSNAGKSSAINAITQRRSLARTSKTPGRTQLLNFFELAPQQRIVDLPGYGYASVPEAQRRQWGPLIDELRVRQSLRGVILVVDARRGLAVSDESLLRWAEGLTTHILLTKADKLNKREATLVRRSAKQIAAGRASVQLFSAHDGLGVEEAQRVLQSWLEQKNTPATPCEIAGAD